MRKTLLILTFVAAAIILASCEKMESDNPVTINLDGSTKMRVAMRVNPELGIHTGDVTISKGDMVYSQPLEFDNGHASILFSDLQPGIWLVEVELRDEDDYVLYQGSGEAGVIGGQTNSATIVLEELSGDLEVVIELPEDWSGSTLRIVSDESWSVSATLVSGWETVTFDDSSWESTVAPPPGNCGTVNCFDDPDVFTMWSSVQHETIYLRRSFSLESDASVITATIKTVCDDDHDLYINGALVASDWDGVAGPVLTTDIKEYLQPGTNVIAIKARDTAGGCRVMCVDAAVVLETLGGLTQLTTDSAYDDCPAWSPDGTQIAFFSNRSGNYDIWVMTSVGGLAIQITTDPGYDSRPAWSPDGSMIAFQSDRNGNRDIWMIPADGGIAMQVTTDLAEDFACSWSPDGSMLVFCSNRSGNQDIWVIPAAGGAATQITSHSALEDGADWSPDGSQIVFMSRRGGGNANLWLIPSSGGEATQLTFHPGGDHWPDWAPHLNLIAYHRHVGGNWDVCVIPVNGGTPIQLTTNPGDDWHPRWSPDCTRIAFSSDREGNQDIWVMDVP